VEATIALRQACCWLRSAHLESGRNTGAMKWFMVVSPVRSVLNAWPRT
jgi:hypothetical protein